MKSKDRLITALLCLAFLALGGCLLLAAKGMLRAEGLIVEKVSLPDGDGTLCRPMAIQAQAVPLPEDPDEEAHADHAHRVDTGGRCGAALILSGPMDGAEALAKELGRRGVAALIPGKDVPAAAAWDWLTAQSFVRISSVALIASADRAEEALSLGAALSSTERAAAALIVLGDADTLRRAADHPGRNLLILTGKEPDAEAMTAFLGADYDGRRNLTGYFGEGTARAVAAVPGRAALFSRPALERIMDWQGSTLGHAVELPDSDVIYGRIVFCQCGAAFCFFAAGAIWLLRRKRGGASIGS